jgi:phospholipase/lecithinase/hemolysin
MASKLFGRTIALCLLFMAALQTNRAEGVTFKRIVVFGTSLSDSGNAFALTGQAIKRPYSELDDFLIPPAPYAAGGYHFSNGATWIEQLARRYDLDADTRPAFADSDEPGWNYAVGGARARDDGVNFNLPNQVAAFLSDAGGVAPADGLYVIDMGANDVRDALAAPSLAETILADALNSIAAQMGILYAAGARKFLLLNVPDLGVAPSVQILDEMVPGAAFFAGMLAQTFNANLDNVGALIGVLPGTDIARLDFHQTVNSIIANPAAFGLVEVEVSCVTPDVRPFTCKKPGQFLFWDGIHPTKAGHEILAKEAVAVLGR